MSLPAFKPKRPWHVDAAGAAIVVALAATVHLLLAVPAQRERDQAERLDAERAAADERRRDLETTVRRASDDVKAVRQMISRGSLQLDPDTKLNQRIAALTQWATRAGLAVDAIEPGNKRPGALFHVVPIRIAGKGRYVQVRDFVSALHREMPDTPITSMNLAAVPSVAEPSVNFSIELHWHTAVIPAAGTAPPPLPHSVQLPTGN